MAKKINKEKKAKIERYHALGEDTIASLNDYISKYVVYPTKINYLFQGDNRLKSLIKVTKVPDLYALHTGGSQVHILLNEAVWDGYINDVDKLEIRLKEELGQIVLDAETNKIKLEKANFSSSLLLIDKFSFKAVKEAKELEKLILEQIADKESENNDIDISM